MTSRLLNVKELAKLSTYFDFQKIIVWVQSRWWIITEVHAQIDTQYTKY